MVIKLDTTISLLEGREIPFVYTVNCKDKIGEGFAQGALPEHAAHRRWIQMHFENAFSPWV